MKEITLHINGQTEIYTLEKYAQLGDVGVMQRVGGSVILCSVCVDFQSENTESFVPLSVQYVERAYASGKIPQGFNRREGKASDSETLISRLIDRSVRPLVRKDFFHSTHITLMLLSNDGKSDIQRDALNLASIALYLSSVPLNHNRILSALRVLREADSKNASDNSQFRICSEINEIANSSLDLFVSGLDSNITMIEMQTLKSKIESSHPNHINTSDLLEAIDLARQNIESNCEIYTQAFSGLKKLGGLSSEIKPQEDSSFKNLLAQKYSNDIKDVLTTLSKTQRGVMLGRLIESISNMEGANKERVATAVYALKREMMREMILKEGKRADGRGLEDIREIIIESDILPHAHSSVCFTRGQTQVLVSVTLGGNKDKDSALASVRDKNVMLHYNFPPFCVGEATPVQGVSRRELGHGNLALRAIQSSIPQVPYIIRIVSEVLQSNGSSSMASVCGASLALRGVCADAKLVAGIAMGLVYESESRYAILSDINGLEDFDGDMDFKIAGSRHGFSALQLDIKIESLSHQILEKSLRQAKAGLDSILNIMDSVEIRQNSSLEIMLPKQHSFSVPQGSIGDIIGRGGSVIREIIARFSVNIDFDRERHIMHIVSNDESSIKNAVEFIDSILVRRYGVGVDYAKEGEASSNLQ